MDFGALVYVAGTDDGITVRPWLTSMPACTPGLKACELAPLVRIVVAGHGASKVLRVSPNLQGLKEFGITCSPDGKDLVPSVFSAYESRRAGIDW